MEKFIKKRIFGIPLAFYYLIALICLVLIIIGSFLDKDISMALYDKSNAYGSFFESFGTLIGYMMIPCGASCLFIGLKDDKRWWIKLIAWALLIVAVFASAYVYGGSLCVSKEEYGLLVDALPAYGFAFFTMGLSVLLTFMFVNKKDKRMLIVVGSIILLSMALQLALLNLFLKYLACRPRWRYLMGDAIDQNGVNESFRAWWEMQPFAFSSGDYHKSWPSGHTATAMIVTCLPLLSLVEEKKHKYTMLVFALIGFIYAFSVAFSRIVAGAHFLSDVAFGGLFSVLGIIASYFIVEALDKKINSKGAN